MNPSTVAKSSRNSPLHEALFQGRGHETNDAWHFQPYRDVTENGAPNDRMLATWACLWLTANNQSVPWLAIPLGQLASGSSSNAFPARLIQCEWETIRPDLSTLPESSALREQYAQELEQLESAMQTSVVVPFEDDLWLLVPCPTWRPVCELVARFGDPSPEILRDWVYQRAGHPGTPCTTLVSPHGLLAAFAPLIATLRKRFGAVEYPSIDDWMRRLGRKHMLARWPTVEREPDAPAPKQPDASVPKENENQALEAVHAVIAVSARNRSLLKKKNSTRPKGSLKNWLKISIPVAIGISVICVVMAMLLRNNDATDPRNSLAETITTSPPSYPMSIESTDNTVLALDSDSGTSEPNDPIELATTPLDTQEFPQLDLDGIIHNALDSSHRSIKQVDEPELVPDVRFEVVAGNQEAIIEDDLADAEQPLDGKMQLELGLSNGPSRKDFKFGRGVVVRNAVCSAALSIEAEEQDDSRDDWIVVPRETQSAQGIGFCEWRVAKEDIDPELVVQLRSKPGNRWLLTTMVGVRMTPSDVPIPLGGNDASLVLQHLATHQRGLVESIEQLRNGPRLPRAFGMPDINNQIRWMQSQNRETEKAIKQWSKVAELCDSFFANGKLKIELSIPSSGP